MGWMDGAKSGLGWGGAGGSFGSTGRHLLSWLRRIQRRQNRNR